MQITIVCSAFLALLRRLKLRFLAVWANAVIKMSKHTASPTMSRQ